MGRNVLFSGADMSSFVHVDNKRKDILILGKGPTQILNRTFSTEGKYTINFTQSVKKFKLSLHYNGSNSFSLLTLQKYIDSKQTTQK